MERKYVRVESAMILRDLIQFINDNDIKKDDILKLDKQDGNYILIYYM